MDDQKLALPCAIGSALWRGNPAALSVLSMQRWLWVTQPQFWEQLHGGGLDDGVEVNWTCDRTSRRGDVALLYRAEVAKDIAHLFRVDDDELWEDVHPVDSKRRAWYCNATLVYTLHHPLPLPVLRAEPRLQSWPALDLNMHALAFEIDPPTWRVLLELAHPRDRIELRKHSRA
jgi:hypothetical protein